MTPRDRRRGRSHLGAHPERRVLAPGRRAALLAPRGACRRGPPGPPGAAVVLPPVVNLFEKPDALSPVVSQTILGHRVGVLEVRRDWALVETDDRYAGWGRRRALAPLGGRAAFPRPPRALVVRNLIANIYRAPDVTSASPIAVAPLLARLESVGADGEWTRVLLPDGRRGWLQSGAVGPEIPAGQERRDARGAGGERLATTALRFLGLPYLWGGTTPFGLDCSGLAQIVYRLHGLVLPRDADLQYADRNLVPVGRDAIQAGDLVFFGPAPAGITHVGIALDRDEFVSATTYRSPEVRRDRLDDPYWKRLYRGSRRAG